MSDKLPDIIDGVELWHYANVNGLRASADLLRRHAQDGLPESFCAGYTSLAMCQIVSNAIEGVRGNGHFQKYADTKFAETKYGPALYAYMWGSDPWPEDVK